MRNDGAPRVVGLFLVVAIASGQAPDAPSSTSDAAFAFSNASGTALLAQADVKEPQRLTSAVCPNGRRVTVRFTARQPSGPNDTGRRTSQNFTQAAGVRYEITLGKADEQDICLLTSDQFLASLVSLPLTSAERAGECAAPLRTRIRDTRKRAVTHCWTLNRIASNAEIVLVQFARRGRNALASVIVRDADRLMFADLPGEYRSDSTTVWRVDDGGELSPKDFDVIAAFRRGDAYLLAVSWAGAEGAALSLYSSKGDRFVTVISDSLYWSPL